MLTIITYKDNRSAGIPEWSKGTVLSTVALASWVRIPLSALRLVSAIG